MDTLEKSVYYYFCLVIKMHLFEKQNGLRARRDIV